MLSPLEAPYVWVDRVQMRTGRGTPRPVKMDSGRDPVSCSLANANSRAIDILAGDDDPAITKMV